MIELNSKVISLEPRQLNKYYLEKFRDSRYPKQSTDQSEFLAWSQYKSTLTRLLGELSEKDSPLYSIDEHDIRKVIDGVSNPATRKNKLKHIKSLLVFLIQEDADFFEMLTKEQVLWILTM